MSVKQRFSRCVTALCPFLESYDASGSLCQMWTPEEPESGIDLCYIELCTQGRSFATAGDADLLALYRYISVAYKFSTDVNRPDSQGAVGRVYMSGRAETCSDVQSLNTDVYHRANEAALCNVNAFLVVPVWEAEASKDSQPLAVCELVMCKANVLDFSDVLSILIKCLHDENFKTADVLDLPGTQVTSRNRCALAPLHNQASEACSQGNSSTESLNNRSGSIDSRCSAGAGSSLSASFRRRYPMAKEKHEHEESSAASATSDDSRSSTDPRREAEALAGRLRAVGKGTDIDRLVIGESIGHGSFGSVHKGCWRNLDVAVKTIVFSDHGGGQSGSQQRAVMEAAVSSSVVHPNVVCTYHYDITPIHSMADLHGQLSSIQIVIEQKSSVTDWKLYLVQELCHTSLRDALVAGFLHDADSSYRPYLDAILLVLLDVASGMDYIHSKGIIHGDLKPENILLKQDIASRLGMSCKITDFGLCTSIDATVTHVSNFSNGTPFYAAPEVVSSGQATRKSDVYCFGVLMWVLMCRMPPWVKGPNGLYQWNESFGTFPKSSPEEYIKLCFQCLQESSKVRPDFSEIITVLQALLKSLKSTSSGREGGQVRRDSAHGPASAPKKSSHSCSPSSSSAAPAPTPQTDFKSQVEALCQQQEAREASAGQSGYEPFATTHAPILSSTQLRSSPMLRSRLSAVALSDGLPTVPQEQELEAPIGPPPGVPTSAPSAPAPSDNTSPAQAATPPASASSHDPSSSVPELTPILSLSALSRAFSASRSSSRLSATSLNDSQLPSQPGSRSDLQSEQQQAPSRPFLSTKLELHKSSPSSPSRRTSLVNSLAPVAEFNPAAAMYRDPDALPSDAQDARSRVLSPVLSLSQLKRGTIARSSSRLSESGSLLALSAVSLDNLADTSPRSPTT